MGIGGTGVVTVSQMLGMAALLDGQHVSGLDQTGLAQKGGPVVSDVRIAARAARRLHRRRPPGVRPLPRLRPARRRQPQEPRDRRPRTARSPSFRPARSRPAAWSSTPAQRFPELAGALDAHRARATRASTTSTSTRSALSERLFGDHMPANTLALGAAYQRGALPVSPAALEQAIRLNGAAVETNLAAFAWGRAAVAAPDAVARRRPAPRPSVAGRASSPRPARARRSPSTATAASCAGCSSSACPS